VARTFSAKSRERLAEAHEDLQRLAYRLLEEMDITVLCGYRGPEAQSAAFQNGTSKAMFGQSPHNYQPSMAIDIAPYPIDWKDTKRFDEMLNHALSIAKELGIEIKLGRDFKGFIDRPHVELADWKKKASRTKK
jgi:peptidoglycan L-alanyl-D-glutamate endopeptidase CwlK